MFDSHYKLKCFSFLIVSRKKKQTVNLKTICQIRKKCFNKLPVLTYFMPLVFFCTLLQISENLCFSGILKGYSKKQIASYGLSLLTVYLLHSAYLPVGDILQNIFNFITATHCCTAQTVQQNTELFVDVPS